MTSPSTTAFTAMGSLCDVTVVGGQPSKLLKLAQSRAHDLERRWSRFIDASEISQLNASSGNPTRVSDDTYHLIDHAVAAWRWTSGRFDPTVLSIMLERGYDRSFELVGQSTDGSTPPEARPTRSPGCANITLDQPQRTVTLPRGVGIDPGGIGKGLAADLIVEALLDAGATGVCASMGGDVRVSGDAPDGGWRVGFANPFLDDDLIAVVQLEDHALATSNRLIRRWHQGEVQHSHLVDPRSTISVNGYVSASIISGRAWWSEVLAKVAMVDARAAQTLLPLLSAEGLYVSADQTVDVSDGFHRFDARTHAA
jgi:FAD:protein FMN transferase